MKLLLMFVMILGSNFCWPANPSLKSAIGPIVRDYYGYYSLLSQIVRDEESSKKTTRGVSYIYFWEPPSRSISHLVACAIDNNRGTYEMWVLKLKWTKKGESILPTARNIQKLQEDGVVKVFREFGVLSEGKGAARIVAKLDSLTFPANPKFGGSGAPQDGLPDSIGMVAICEGRIQVLSIYATNDLRQKVREIFEDVYRLAE